MTNTTPIAVWSYLVVATLFEWALAKNFLSPTTIYTNIVIAALAASQILAVAMVFLRLKYEPRGIVGIAAASIFFAVLAVVLAFGSIGHQVRRLASSAYPPDTAVLSALFLIGRALGGSMFYLLAFRA